MAGRCSLPSLSSTAAIRTRRKGSPTGLCATASLALQRIVSAELTHNLAVIMSDR